MKPTVGRIVHYCFDALHPGKSDPWPAIITRVLDDGSVDLTLFPPGADPATMEGVSFSDEPKYGSWTWPVINSVVTTPLRE